MIFRVWYEAETIQPLSILFNTAQIFSKVLDWLLGPRVFSFRIFIFALYGNYLVWFPLFFFFLSSNLVNVAHNDENFVTSNEWLAIVAESPFSAQCL